MQDKKLKKWVTFVFAMLRATVNQRLSRAILYIRSTVKLQERYGNVAPEVTKSSISNTRTEN